MRSWPFALVSMTMLSAATVVACTQFDAAEASPEADASPDPAPGEGGPDLDSGIVTEAGGDSDVPRCTDLLCEDWDQPNAFQGWTPEVTNGNNFGVAPSARSAPQAFRS